MAIPPSYTITNSMLTLFAKLEANKSVFQQSEIPLEIIENIQRQSLLNSSLFSAKIEGNNLTISQVQRLTQKDEKVKEKLEVSNIMHALRFTKTNVVKQIDRDTLLHVHTLVMNKLIESKNLGKLRKEPSAIFNSAGFPVYIPPPPSEVPVLFEQLVQFINDSEEKNVVIRAILSHIIFEKIHPFLDGNGRVGRLLFQWILAKENYHFNWLLSFEEVLNERKEEYYAYLDEQEATHFIEFTLEVLCISSDKILSQISKKEFNKEDVLLPRRKEILNIIRDHKMVSLDMIKRRFFKVPERTLRYDLKQLEKKGFVLKVGTTRGALYTVARS